jgi:hypothetical protein
MIFFVTQIAFLLCLALCFWKKLWLALGVLLAVIVASTALRFAFDSPVGAAAVAFLGVLAAFPLTVYFNLESREKQERRKSIRRTRRHTGRDA